jgi:hypothetical protein
MATCEVKSVSAALCPLPLLNKVAGQPHLIRRDRLDLEADVGDELVELRAVFVTDPGIENDARLQRLAAEIAALGAWRIVCANCSASGSSRKIATNAEVSTALRSADPARRSR